jgi:hypothetical protein
MPIATFIVAIVLIARARRRAAEAKMNAAMVG